MLTMASSSTSEIVVVNNIEDVRTKIIHIVKLLTLQQKQLRDVKKMVKLIKQSNAIEIGSDHQWEVSLRNQRLYTIKLILSRHLHLLHRLYCFVYATNSIIKSSIDRKLYEYAMCLLDMKLYETKRVVRMVLILDPSLVSVLQIKTEPKCLYALPYIQSTPVEVATKATQKYEFEVYARNPSILHYIPIISHILRLLAPWISLAGSVFTLPHIAWIKRRLLLF